MSDQIEWPREIWAAERGEHEPTGVHVFSEHATVARWEGDKERDREFHRYVDSDILDSTERYYRAKLEQARSEALAMVAAEREACAKRGGDAAVEILLRHNPDATPFRQQATRQAIVRAIRSQEDAR